jgi:hypothetical protein
MKRILDLDSRTYGVLAWRVSPGHAFERRTGFR